MIIFKNWRKNKIILFFRRHFQNKAISGIEFHHSRTIISYNLTLFYKIETMGAVGQSLAVNATVKGSMSTRFE